MISIAAGATAVIVRQVSGTPAGSLFTPPRVGLLAATGSYAATVVARRILR